VSLEKQTAELAALKAQIATVARVIVRLDKGQMVAAAR
jgi:cell division protein FtsB